VPEIAPRDELAPDMIYAGGDLLGGHINVLEQGFSQSRG
jgi:hypothetical protein